MNRAYRTRYRIETGEFVPPVNRKKVRADVSVSPDDYGYADDLVVLSVVRKDGVGPLISCLFMGTWEGKVMNPESIPRAVMELVRDQAQHYLDHHCPEDQSCAS